MKDPYYMSGEEFKMAMDALVIESDVWSNTHRIYDYLTEVFGTDCNDSILREWTFEWWSAKTNKDYSVIYNKWLDGV